MPADEYKPGVAAFFDGRIGRGDYDRGGFHSRLAEHVVTGVWRSAAEVEGSWDSSLANPLTLPLARADAGVREQIHADFRAGVMARAT